MRLAEENLRKSEHKEKLREKQQNTGVGRQCSLFFFVTIVEGVGTRTRKIENFTTSTKKMVVKKNRKPEHDDRRQCFVPPRELRK